MNFSHVNKTLKLLLAGLSGACRPQFYYGFAFENSPIEGKNMVSGRKLFFESVEQFHSFERREITLLTKRYF